MNGHLYHKDWVTALLIGLGVGGVACCLALSGPMPCDCGELSVALGPCPPAEMFPGLWRALVSGFDFAVGPRLTTLAVSVFGCVLLGVVAFLTYLAFVTLLSVAGKGFPCHVRRLEGLVRLLAFVGAVSFVTTDRVWQAGLSGSPLILSLTGVLAAFAGVWYFFSTGRGVALAPAAFVLGLFSADSPCIALLTFGWAGVYALAEWRVRAASRVRAMRLVLGLVRGKVCFAYALGVLAGLGGLFALFVFQGGDRACGLSGGPFFAACFSQWMSQLSVPVTPVLRLFVAVLVLSPFALSLVMARMRPRLSPCMGCAEPGGGEIAIGNATEGSVVEV